MIYGGDYVASVKLSCSTIYKRADGIIVFAPVKSHFTLDEIKAQLNGFLEIQKGEVSPLLVLPGKLQKLEDEQKKFMNANISRFASKLCILTNNPLPTFIFNIIFYLTPPPIPSRVLKTESEAIAWLKKDL
ncbi:MAG: hypothetical protein K0Q95_2059 [Bacteroidota bacterium]|jgi:hypothetical protein|nr:hypothetical protein [Bacteroidota bacterium]